MLLLKMRNENKITGCDMYISQGELILLDISCNFHKIIGPHFQSNIKNK